MSQNINWKIGPPQSCQQEAISEYEISTMDAICLLHGFRLSIASELEAPQEVT